MADIVVPDDLEITVHNDTEGDLFLIEGTLWQDRFGGPLKVSTVAAGGASTFSVEPNNRLSWCQPRNWGIWAIEDFEGPGQIAGAPEAPLAKLVPKIRDASPDGFDVVSKLRVGRCWGRPSGEWRVAAPEG